MSSSSVFVEVTELVAADLDYIIVGGGTAGLSVAVRLAETPDVRVGVLEAGAHITSDPMLDQLRFIGTHTSNPKYDWCDKTEPMPSLDGRVMEAPRGKMLGGSTGINFMAWDRGSRADYDAWTRFGGEGWSFDGLLPYFKKTEDARSVKENPNSMIAASTQVAGGGFEESTGTKGPVKVSYNDTDTDVQGVFVKTWNGMGVPTSANHFAGEKHGVINHIRAVDLQEGKRMTSASAYLPLANPDNVKVLLGAQVSKVVFDGTNSISDAPFSASGVEFVVAGKVYTVHAKKEIILCAGTLRTPHLLELSGIGNAQRLRALGIDPLIDLPGVGENLQDQMFVPVQYRLKPDIKTKDLLRDSNSEFYKREEARYAATKRGWFMTGDMATAFLPLAETADATTHNSIVSKIEELIRDEKTMPLHRAQYAAQLEMLKAQSTPIFEFLQFAAGFVDPQPGQAYTVLVSGLLTPFSRGHVHIKSSEASLPPQIQPNYFSNELDMDLSLIAFDKYAEFAEAVPFKDIVLERQLPPMPRDNLEGYVKMACLSSGHLIGTAAMAPREIGGVVGGDLKVHGTKNLRVVDASVFPVAVAGHTQATVYALAEKAADIIKNGAQAPPHGPTQD